MQFHEYITVRNRDAKHNPDEKMRDNAHQKGSKEYREFWYEYAGKKLDELTSDLPDDPQREDLIDLKYACWFEISWNENERPFYNVWPIALDICKSVKLDIPINDVPRVGCLLLRFPIGLEPCGIRTACVFNFGPRSHPELYATQMVTYFEENVYSTQGFKNETEMTVEQFISNANTKVRQGAREPSTENSLGMTPNETVMRLVMLIGLLQNDEDVITPVVLSKDQKRYDFSDDVDTKKWLEDRAARRQGRGFDFGRTLQKQKEVSPHWRNPHFALFWTGPGRKIPVLKMRKGSIVQRVSMAEVPTGYLGPEDPSEDDWIDEENQRIPISAGLRFDIFKRDNFTCQMCGRNVKEDGVKLHVDHIVPVSKGGGIEESNLQTACQDCNLGKSDKDI